MVFLASIFLPALFSSVAARLVVHPRQATEPFGPTNLSPLEDPFYVPDPGTNITPLKPGTIIKYRKIRTTNTAVESTWQLLYRSESQNGTALAAVTTIWIPVGAPKDRFVLTAKYDNSDSRKCAPSWRYTNGSIDDTNFINKKWIVSSADHEGPDAAFNAGRLQARVLLDGGRATINFATAGLARTAKIVINGYSGGAGAAGWAASLASTYSPDLNIVGATFGGTPANGTAIIQYADGGLFSGLSLLGAFGIAKAYKALDDRFAEILTPAGKTLREQAADRCGAYAYQSLAGTRFLSTSTQTLGTGILTDSIFKPIADSLVLGNVASETPKIPMFVYHGNIDQIIPENTVSPSIKAWCSNGANLLYQRIYLAEHFTGFLDVNVVPFIESRFNGVAWPNGCRYADTTFAFENIAVATAGVRQQVGPSPAIKWEADRAQAREKAAIDKAATADPATKRREIEKRLGAWQNGGN